MIDSNSSFLDCTQQSCIWFEDLLPEPAAGGKLVMESWTSHKQQLQIVDGMRKSLKDSDTDTAPLLSQNIFSLIWGGN